MTICALGSRGCEPLSTKSAGPTGVKVPTSSERNISEDQKTHLKDEAVRPHVQSEGDGNGVGRCVLLPRAEGPSGRPEVAPGGAALPARMRRVAATACVLPIACGTGARVARGLRGRGGGAHT